MLRRYFGEFARAAFLLVNRLLQRSELCVGRALILTIRQTLPVTIGHHLVSHFVVVHVRAILEHVVGIGARAVLFVNTRSILFSTLLHLILLFLITPAYSFPTLTRRLLCRAHHIIHLVLVALKWRCRRFHL